MDWSGSSQKRGEKLSFTIPILNVRLRLSFWFFALVAFSLRLERQVLLWYIVLPIVVHELGHLLAIAFCRAGLREIHLTPVSIRIVTRAVTHSYRKELIIAGAGIAANLILALWLRLFAFQSLRTMLMIVSNLAVAAFNLLPVGNLDGGKLAGLFFARYLEPRAAHTAGAALSFIVLLPLSCMAGLVLLRGENFTLAAICVYLIAVSAAGLAGN